MKFRTMSVAKSTVNRILNIADEISRAAPMPNLPSPGVDAGPAIPMPDGSTLDAALNAPTPPVAGTPQLAEASLAESLGL